jgi:hypothetical protein
MLLSEIRKEYTELLKYIISLKSSIWKPIERIVRNSLETNDYSESVILKYLELSKDITTDLYTRLYTVTEPIRRNFEDAYIKSGVEFARPTFGGSSQRRL